MHNKIRNVEYLLNEVKRKKGNQNRSFKLQKNNALIGEGALQQNINNTISEITRFNLNNKKIRKRTPPLKTLIKNSHFSSPSPPSVEKSSLRSPHVIQVKVIRETILRIRDTYHFFKEKNRK